MESTEAPPSLQHRNDETTLVPRLLSSACCVRAKAVQVLLQGLQDVDTTCHLLAPHPKP